MSEPKLVNGMKNCKKLYQSLPKKLDGNLLQGFNKALSDRYHQSMDLKCDLWQKFLLIQLNSIVK